MRRFALIVGLIVAASLAFGPVSSGGIGMAKVASPSVDTLIPHL
jgi:hypothetical protein